MQTKIMCSNLQISK